MVGNFPERAGRSPLRRYGLTMRPRRMVVMVTVLAGTLSGGCSSSSDEPQTTTTQSATSEPAATTGEWPKPKSDHDDSEGFIVECISDYAAARTRFNIARNEYQERTGEDWSVDGEGNPILLKDYLRPWRVILKYPDCFQPKDVKKARRITNDLG